MKIQYQTIIGTRVFYTKIMQSRTIPNVYEEKNKITTRNNTSHRRELGRQNVAQGDIRYSRNAASSSMKIAHDDANIKKKMKEDPAKRRKFAKRLPEFRSRGILT